MFKRIALAVALTLALSVPAMAENSGFYVGLKFLDSIQSTGSMSRSGAVVNAFDVKNYSQNTVGGGIYAGYDFGSCLAEPFMIGFKARYANEKQVCNSFKNF